MLLSISPALIPHHYEILNNFLENPTGNIPSKFCMWKLATNGLFICAPDICVELRHPYLKWLIYLIKNYFVKWEYYINGFLSIRTFYCVVENNQITIESFQDENLHFVWNNDNNAECMKKSYINTLKHFMAAEIIFKNWKIIELEEKSKYNSMVDNKNRIFYIQYRELYNYCKKFGMKNVLGLLENHVKIST